MFHPILTVLIGRGYLNIPIKDCSSKGEHVKFWVSQSSGVLG